MVTKRKRKKKDCLDISFYPNTDDNNSNLTELHYQFFIHAAKESINYENKSNKKHATKPPKRKLS